MKKLTFVLFKNLLDDMLDINVGYLIDDKMDLYCLCGCNGLFERGDYKILRQIEPEELNAALLKHYGYPECKKI